MNIEERHISEEVVKICVDMDVVAARHSGRIISKNLQFNHIDQARIVTAISELARNIYLYAKTGEIILTPIYEVNRIGLRVVALDFGPGIIDVPLALTDGYTTSHGLGAGLPGVRRLMDDFHLETEVGKGTKITIDKWVK